MSDPGAMARALERELDTQDAERRRIDKERIVMLEEALRFYADNPPASCICGVRHRSELCRDRGRRARLALETVAKEERDAS
jgi:hypothetical protein